MTIDAELFKSVQLFRDLSDEHLQALAEHARLRRMPEGEVLFREGDPGLGLYIVRSGEVEILIEVPQKSSVTLTLIGPGGAFGELALLDGEPRSATARVRADSEFVYLGRDDFQSLLNNEPDFQRALLTSLASVVRTMNVRLADAAFLDVHGRIANVFLDLVDTHGVPVQDGILIDRPLTLADLASLSGLYEAEVATRVADYQYENFISKEGDLFTVRRADVFRDWANRSGG